MHSPAFGHVRNWLRGCIRGHQGELTVQHDTRLVALRLGAIDFPCLKTARMLTPGFRQSPDPREPVAIAFISLTNPDRDSAVTMVGWCMLKRVENQVESFRFLRLKQKIRSCFQGLFSISFRGTSIQHDKIIRGSVLNLRFQLQLAPLHDGCHDAGCRMPPGPAEAVQRVRVQEPRAEQVHAGLHGLRGRHSILWCFTSGVAGPAVGHRAAGQARAGVVSSTCTQSMLIRRTYSARQSDCMIIHPECVLCRHVRFRLKTKYFVTYYV